MRANRKSLVCVSVLATLVAAGLVVATSSPLAAQERRLHRPNEDRAPVEPGARVRVTAPDLGINKDTGVLEGVVGETLVVSFELPPTRTEAATLGQPLRIGLASVTNFEVHRGRKSRVGRSALIGTAVGVGGGALLGAAAFYGSCFFEGSDPCPVGGALMGAGLLVLPGLLVGTVVGVLTKTDRWEAVPLGRIRVTFTPVRNGRLAILASVRVP
jgi:hypothetical protein